MNDGNVVYYASLAKTAAAVAMAFMFGMTWQQVRGWHDYDIKNAFDCGAIRVFRLQHVETDSDNAKFVQGLCSRLEKAAGYGG